MRINRDLSSGVLALSFFALVFFVLIPLYVPVPSFIPGFAPPPDMWPKTTAVLGMAMGVLALALAIAKSKKPALEQAPDADVEDLVVTKPHMLRLAVLVVSFLAFIYGMPFIGFVPASILLLGVLFAMTGTYRHKWLMVALSVIFPLALYFIFSQFIHTLFPMGSLFS
ncbi:tripartite tricarboxylate transporter TctB family protein [Terasakiella pusilla]|uniref:tripartite tricarboxylate transporter TctB family protein n=1 Tax=Terasakiella pusilla TaxID=64973 RepID=UPI003AA807AF